MKINIGSVLGVLGVSKSARILSSAVLLAGCAVRAADITWSQPQPIFDEQDVCTFWSLDRAYKLGTAKGKPSVTVNGVLFKLWNPGLKAGAKPGVIANNDTVLAVSGFGGGIGLADNLLRHGLSSLPPDYQELLQSGIWNDGSACALILNNLTPGHACCIQMWFNDSRNTNQSQTLIGGGNTSAPVQFNPCNKVGGIGQYITGLFVADGFSQAITMNPQNKAALLNAFQLRVSSGNPLPLVISPPVSLTQQIGTKAAISVGAWGHPTLSYHWQKISTAKGFSQTNYIAGATNSALLFPRLSGTDAGIYQVQIVSEAGMVTSRPATVNLISDVNLVWTGLVSSNWDVGKTMNWMAKDTSARYADNNPVRLDDAAHVTDVNIASAVSPYSILVTNDTSNYVIGGGPIGGLASLTKSGKGMLTLTGKNTYRGGTTINNGVLLVASEDQLGVGPLNFNGGTLDCTGNSLFSSERNITVNSNGCVIRIASGKDVTFSGSINGLGDLTKEGNGLLIVTGTNNTFAGRTIVNAGKLVVTGDGGSTRRTMGLGTLIINRGASAEFTRNFGLSGPSAGKALKIDGGALRIDGSSYILNIAMAGGTITVTNGCSLKLLGYLTCRTAPTDTAAVIKSEKVQLFDGVQFDVARGTAAIDLRVIGGCFGPGTFTKTGDGIMVLDGKNTYAGTTTVSNGILALAGSVNSPLVVQTKGTLAVGTTNTGAFAATRDLKLNGNILLRICKNANTPTCDQIYGLTNVSYGGMLTITNITSDAAPLAAGDTFTLFKSAAYQSVFTQYALPQLPAGLKWDLSSLSITGDHYCPVKFLLTGVSPL